MNALRRRSEGNYVILMQEKLNELGYGLVVDGYFGAKTEEVIRDFQDKNKLKVDGIVGVKTWQILFAGEQTVSTAGTTGKFVSERNFEEAAGTLGVETAIIKAVQEVETGGRSGFLSNGKPAILFEGHIFWKQLKDHGLDPQQFRQGNETILYPAWTKVHYLGGAAEYGRLEQAKAIHEESALCSASWGMFQIMGFNHRACDFDTVHDFIETHEHSEGRQLIAFIKFIENTPGHTALKQLDWRGFARYYNGAGYEKNNYHTKLEKAYKRFAS